MKRVQKVISTYVNENFHVSLMLVFYFELTNIYTERKKNIEEYIFLFFITFLAYNYLRKEKYNPNKQLNLYLIPIYLIGIVYTSIFFLYLNLLNMLINMLINIIIGYLGFKHMDLLWVGKQIRNNNTLINELRSIWLN